MNRSKFNEKEGSDERRFKVPAFGVGVQISPGVDSQVSAEGSVWAITPRIGGGVPRIGSAEGMSYRGGSSAAGPRAGADLDSSEVCLGTGGRFSEGRERSTLRGYSVVGGETSSASPTAREPERAKVSQRCKVEYPIHATASYPMLPISLPLPAAWRPRRDWRNDSRARRHTLLGVVVFMQRSWDAARDEMHGRSASVRNDRSAETGREVRHRAG